MKTISNNRGNMLISTLSAIMFITISVASLYTLMNVMGNTLVNSATLEQEMTESQVTLNHASDTVKHLITNNSLNIDEDSIENTLSSMFPEDDISISQVPTDSISDISFDIDITVGYSSYYQNVLIKNYQSSGGSPDNGGGSDSTCDVDLVGTIEWDATVQYLAGDILSDNGSYYISTNYIRGGSSPSNNSRSWVELESSCITPDTYSSKVQYSRGDFTYYKSELFTAVTSVKDVTPTPSSSPVIDYSSWVPAIQNSFVIDIGDNNHRAILGERYEALSSYDVDDVIYHNLEYYVTARKFNGSYSTPNLLGSYFVKLGSFNHVDLSINISDVEYTGSNNNYYTYDLYFDYHDSEFTLCLESNCKSRVEDIDYTDVNNISNPYFVLNTTDALPFIKNSNYLQGDIIYDSDTNAFYYCTQDMWWLSTVHNRYGLIKLITHGEIITNYHIPVINSNLYLGQILIFKNQLYISLNEGYYLTNTSVIESNNGIFNKLPTSTYFDEDDAKDAAANSPTPGSSNYYFLFLGENSRGEWTRSMNTWSIGTICEYQGKFYYKYTATDNSAQSSPEKSDSRWYEISTINEYQLVDSYISNTDYAGGIIAIHNDKIYIKNHCPYYDDNTPGTSSSCWVNGSQIISWQVLDDVIIRDSLPESTPPIVGDIEIIISDVKKRQ